MDARPNWERQEMFRRWFEAPIALLKKLPRGDGGFVALATALMLYERYARAALGKVSRKEASTAALAKQLAADLTAAGLGIDLATAKEFWSIYRHGILHRAFPKRQPGRLPEWHMTHGVPQPIVRHTENGVTFFVVDPWKFADFVLKIWRDHPQDWDAAIPSDGDAEYSFPFLHFIPPRTGLPGGAAEVLDTPEPHARTESERTAE
jgi:hypothetical protein